MQVVTIGSLLESAVACSSSSKFLSQSPLSGQHGNATRMQQASGVVQGITQTRSREDPGLQLDSSCKKLKVDCPMLTVLPECWMIVGRLQLCNRDVHFWNGFSVPADCLALTDSTATICCCICQGPDPRYLGKTVKVSSWSFIPRKRVLATNKTDTCVTGLKVSSRNEFEKLSVGHVSYFSATNTENNWTRRLCESKNTDSHNCSRWSLGTLEIHSFELVDEDFTGVPTFPSLFVNPIGAGSRNAWLELPYTSQENKGSELVLSGFPHCISPPFILPCKYSIDDSSPRSAFRGPDRAEGSKERLTRMLGFFVEFHLCPCSLTDIHSSCERWHGREQGRATIKQEVSDDRFMSFSSMFSISERCPLACLKKLKLDSLSNRLRPEFRPSYVYFSGSVAAWRPILSGALGRCITITGLRRRVILVGREKSSHVIFVATRTSVVTLHPERELLTKNPMTSSTETSYFKGLGLEFNNVILGREGCQERNCSQYRIDTRFQGQRAQRSETDTRFQGQTAQRSETDFRQGDQAHMCMDSTNEVLDGKVISFIGVVTDVLLQDTLVELDDRVWLLLTHQRHTKLHGLRIGAMLSLRDVHVTTIKDCTGKALLLGACMQSHVSLDIHRDSFQESSIKVHSRPVIYLHILILGRVLSLIGSFRQKFHDIYSNKELLGAKKVPGLIQKYAENMMITDVKIERDVFNELFAHDQFCQLGRRLAPTLVKQVPPISNFCKYVWALWQNPSSFIWSRKRDGFPLGQGKWARWKEPLSHVNASGLLRHLFITSQELGVILLGSLQVCQVSGKLQLVDATGAVDIMIPDLFSSEHFSRTYQVSSFTVVVERLCKTSPVVDQGLIASSMSWSSILKEVKADPRFSGSVKFYVLFYIKDATYLPDLSWCKVEQHQTYQPYYLKESSLLENQTLGGWAKAKSYLHSLRIWFQLRTGKIHNLCSRGHVVDILQKHATIMCHDSCSFKVSCKVVAVKLLLFEWQGFPAFSAPHINPSTEPGVKCSLTQSCPSFVPLTLGCFVVDDGSGPADCWAIGDAAVSLLGLVKDAGQLKLHSAILDRLCINLAKAYGLQSSTTLSVEQTLCWLVQRHGWIILRSESPYGDPRASHYSIYGNGGVSLVEDEQAVVQAIVSGACHSGSLVVMGYHMPSMQKIFADCCKPVSPFEALYPRAYQKYLPFDDSRAQLFAQKVGPAVCMSDLGTMSNKVSRLLIS